MHLLLAFVSVLVIVCLDVLNGCVLGCALTDLCLGVLMSCVLGCAQLICVWCACLMCAKYTGCSAD